VKVFREVNRQRIRAESATWEAEKQKNKAISAQLETEQQRKEAVLQQDRAEAKAKRVLSNSIINAIEQQNPDASTAFLLTELAFKMDANNTKTVQQMLRTVYDAPQVWNYSLTSHDAAVWAIAYSPDGRKLVSGSTDGCIKVWDVVAKKELYSFFTVPNNLPCYTWEDLKQEDVTYDGKCGYVIKTLAFSPDGSKIAAGMLNGTVRVWETETPSSYITLDNGFIFNQSIYYLTFSPDGKRLLAGESFGEIVEWDLATSDFRKFGSGSKYFLYSLDYLDNGKTILATLEQSPTQNNYQLKGDIFFIDANSWQMRDSFNRNVRNLDCAKLYKNNILATADETGLIVIWDVKKKIVWDTLQDTQLAGLKVVSMDFTPNGKYLLVGYADMFSLHKNIAIWNIGSKKPVFILNGHSENLTCVAYAPNATQFATGSFDRTINLWRIEQDTPVYTFNIGDESSIKNGLPFSDGRRFLLQVQKMSPPQSRIQVWDNILKKKLLDVMPHESAINSIELSPNERFILSGSGVGSKDTDLDDAQMKLISPIIKQIMGRLDDFSTCIWQIDPPREVFRFSDHQAQIDAVAWAPDGLHFAWSGEEEGKLYVGRMNPDGSTEKIWETDDGTKVLAFTRDSRYVVAYHAGLTVWDFVENKPVKYIRKNPDDIPLKLMPLPDSVHFLLVTMGGQISLVNIRTGLTKYVIDILFGFNTSVSLGSDGANFVVNTLDNRILVYDAKNGALLYDFNKNNRLVDQVMYLGGAADRIGLLTQEGLYLRTVNPDSLINDCFEHKHPGELTAGQIARYDLEETFTYTTGDIQKLLSTKNESWILAIADYYLTRARETPSLEIAKQYYPKAAALYQALPGMSQINLKDSYLLRLRAIEKEFGN